ncbi:hypothetical protein BD410DRAFT_853527 [Rickenella mellea]|uniref:Uncharacterized protein n=1 Tax=Rickenella mellea TaxID=50990 RepID=A0A4Y7PJP4_9AGAM|nr:hypothetical protein BD410DRAFT_853527 [Rickenella mellea]
MLQRSLGLEPRTEAVAVIFTSESPTLRLQWSLLQKNSHNCGVPRLGNAEKLQIQNAESDDQVVPKHEILTVIAINVTRWLLLWADADANNVNEWSCTDTQIMKCNPDISIEPRKHGFFAAARVKPRQMEQLSVSLQANIQGGIFPPEKLEIGLPGFTVKKLPLRRRMLDKQPETETLDIPPFSWSICLSSVFEDEHRRRFGRLFLSQSRHLISGGQNGTFKFVVPSKVLYALFPAFDSKNPMFDLMVAETSFDRPSFIAPNPLSLGFRNILWGQCGAIVGIRFPSTDLSLW